MNADYCIRCENCKHYQPISLKGLGYCYLKNFHITDSSFCNNFKKKPLTVGSKESEDK